MRILMVTATYTPSANGVAVSIENLKASLQKLGHEVKVLAPNIKNSKKEKDVIRYSSLKNPFIKDYPIPIFPGLKSIYKLITTFKPDIIHAHHPFQVGFFAKILSESFKVPLVFTYHTMYDQYATKYARFLPKKLKVKIIEKNVDDFCKKVDLIIAPSMFLKDKLSAKYKNAKVVCIPSALPNLFKSKESKKIIRDRLKLPNNKTILLSVSRLAKEKNIEVLIKSLKYLSDKHLLLLAGSGPEEKNLKKISEKLDITDRIIFAGKVPHKKINLFYQSADVFYYASQTETQGLVFLEAMDFSLPIVAVDSLASREWVVSEVGVIAKNSAKDLAKKLLSFKEEWSENLSKNARKYSQKFTQKRITKKVIKEYRDLMNTRND